MAKNKKPKFLEKETPELMALLKETLSADEVDEKKALKLTEELISRLPAEEGPISVDEALKAAAEVMTEALNKVKGAYDNEIAMMEDSDGDGDDEDEAETEAEEEEDEEEEEAPKKKSKKAAKEEKPAKKSKKSKKKPEPEEEEDDSDEDDEDSDEDGGDYEDYSDWPTKDLKKECRNRGIKVTKSMTKADMVKALEADDQE